MRNDTLVMKSYMANVESKMSNYCTIWDTPTQALKITESITQVGDTTITATSNSVIIKAGGIEATIDSKGLIVKGGEVKSE